MQINGQNVIDVEGAFALEDRSVLSWEGQNYVPQSEFSTFPEKEEYSQYFQYLPNEEKRKPTVSDLVALIVGLLVGFGLCFLAMLVATAL